MGVRWELGTRSDKCWTSEFGAAEREIWQSGIYSYFIQCLSGYSKRNITRQANGTAEGGVNERKISEGSARKSDMKSGSLS